LFILFLLIFLFFSLTAFFSRGRAVTEYGSSDVTTIVAVYHALDGTIEIVAPCGMCREMLSDYAPEARVLMPQEHEGYRATPISELLPGKYSRPPTA